MPRIFCTVTWYFFIKTQIYLRHIKIKFLSKTQKQINYIKIYFLCKNRKEQSLNFTMGFNFVVSYSVLLQRPTENKTNLRLLYLRFKCVFSRWRGLANLLRKFDLHSETYFIWPKKKTFVERTLLTKKKKISKTDAN